MKAALSRPINVSWLLTNACNYKCGFCWRVLDRKDLTLLAAKNITHSLARAGTRKISWAGGEPLMWSGIDALIRFTKGLGIETMLITNGSLIEEVWPHGLPDYLDWLTLPLEGVGEGPNISMGRDPGHYERVTALLRRYKTGNVLLKINSVASIINRHNLIQIVPMLVEWGVRRWKVFQFYPLRGAARHNIRRYQLGDDEFELLRIELIEAARKYGYCGQLVIESCDDLDQSYYTLAPNGGVYVSLLGRDIYLGDAKVDDPEVMFARIELDKRKYSERNNWMLPGLPHQHRSGVEETPYRLYSEPRKPSKNREGTDYAGRH